MSGALAEALLAAQRQAVALLSKQYVAGNIDGNDLLAALDGIGLRDAVDQGTLLDALAVVKLYGGEAPKAAGAGEPKADEPASEAQMKYLRDLADRKGTLAPDWPLTKEQASKVIEQLKAGTYNVDEYTAPV